MSSQQDHRKSGNIKVLVLRKMLVKMHLRKGFER
jgi:hypothetical protein